MSSGNPQISVIVACVDCARSVAASLDAIAAACAGFATEVLVVDASRDDTAGQVRATHPGIAVLSLPPGTLVPQLWAAGLEAARGDIVAVTIGQCVVNRGWAAALVSEIEAGAAGAGGAFALAVGASQTDRALFLLRYSAFLGDRPEGSVPDVAGDNAAYRLDLLRKYRQSWRDGFWEVEFHRQLAPADGPLRFTPRAVAEFRADARLSGYLRQRFEHGRRFGWWRVRVRGESVLRVVAPAPVVPLVMLRRIGGRVRRSSARSLLLSALPQLLLLAGAWALGEAAGALATLGHATSRAGGRAETAIR